MCHGPVLVPVQQLPACPRAQALPGAMPERQVKNKLNPVQQKNTYSSSLSPEKHSVFFLGFMRCDRMSPWLFLGLLRIIAEVGTADKDLVRQ